MNKIQYQFMVLGRKFNGLEKTLPLKYSTLSSSNQILCIAAGQNCLAGLHLPSVGNTRTLCFYDLIPPPDQQVTPCLCLLHLLSLASFLSVHHLLKVAASPAPPHTLCTASRSSAAAPAHLLHLPAAPAWPPAAPAAGQ